MPGSIQTIRGEIIIRQSRPEDAMPYRALRLDALQNEPAAFASDYEKNLLRPDTFWQDRLKFDPDSEALFFAEREANLVGMTGIYRGAGKKQQHSATIWGVYVKPDFRGLQIAEALVRACLDWARGHGVVIAKLGVGAGNQAAIRCYERCGFVSYGIEPKAGFYAGKYHDMNLMACPLD